MRMTMRAMSRRTALVAAAFVLAVNSLTVIVPFISSSQVSAFGGVVATTDPALSGWNLSATGATGHNELIATGLRVWTEGATTTDKAAGYRATPGLLLSDVDTASINFASYTGGRPSVQIGVDRDGNGTWDGYLVYEPWSYGDGQYWVDKDGFGVPAGGGYKSMGTLSQYQAANPSAKVTNIGYSLGSGVHGDAVISSIVIGATTYTFGLPTDTVAPSVVGVQQVLEQHGAGDRINVTLTFSEAINPASIGQGWYAVVGSGNTAFTKAFYSDKTYVITFADVAGNAGSYVLAVDKTAPLGTISYSPSTPTNSSVTVTLDVNEPIKQASLPGTWLKKSETRYQKVYPANTTQLVTLEDLTGNKSSVTVQINWIDKTGPTVTLKTDASTVGSGPYKKVSYKLYDVNKVAKAEVNGHVIPLSPSVWSDLNNIGVGTMFGVLGLNTVKVWDALGNVTEVSFTLDNVAPTTVFTYSNNNGAAVTNQDVTVTMDVSEVIQTPLGWTQLSPTRYAKVYSANQKDSVTITDFATNSATLGFEVKRIDKQSPAVVVMGSGSNNVYRGAVNITATDQNFSKVTVNGVAVATRSLGGWDYALNQDLTGDGSYVIVTTDKGGNQTTTEFVINNELQTSISAQTDTFNPVISGQLSYVIDGAYYEVAGVDVVVEVDGVSYAAKTDASGAWRVPVAVGNGQHAVIAMLVNDDSSLTTIGQASFSTVVTPPAEQSTPPTPESNTSNRGPAAPSVVLPPAINPGAADVLGDSDATQPEARDVRSSSDGDVQGATTFGQAETDVTSDANTGKFMGIAWYWWLLIVASVLGLIWGIVAAARNRRDDE